MKVLLLVMMVVLAVYESFSQEILVPMDEEGLVEIIDVELEKDLQLFQDFNTLIDVTLFLEQDSSYVMEIFYKTKENFLQIRKPLSYEEVQDFRKKVSTIINTKGLIPPEEEKEKHGFFSMLF